VVFDLGLLSEEGGFPPPPGLDTGSFYGAIYGTATDPQFPGQVGDQFVITGPRGNQGVPFPVVVRYYRQGMERTDTLTAVQETGP
jgi:hypothetical protein